MTNPRSKGWLGKISQHEKKISTLTNIFLIISIFFGIVVFIWERYESALIKRQQAALEFFYLRHGSNYSEYSEMLNESLLKHDRLRIALGNQADAKQRGSEEILNEVGIGKIDALAKFYSTVASCAEKKVCDKAIVSSLFKDEMTFFYCSMKEHVLPAIERKFSNEQSYEPLKTYFQENIKECPTRTDIV